MHDVSEAKEGDCALRAQVLVLERDRIVVSYEFRNESDRDVFLFDQLWLEVLPQGLFAVEARRAWVEIDKGAATLSAKIVAVPEGMFVEKPNVPLVTRVEPRGTHRGQLEAALPLRTETPYREAEPGPSVVHPRPLWLEIGYFAATQEGAALAKKVMTTSGPGLRFDPFPIDGQRVLRAGPLHEGVPALDCLK